MKTLVIDAIIGAGFPTLTLALTAEQAGLATFVGAYLSPSAQTHQWCRDKLEGETLQALQTIYEGLRSERDLQAILAGLHTSTYLQHQLSGMTQMHRSFSGEALLHD